jgi:hypothetical protein
MQTYVGRTLLSAAFDLDLFATHSALWVQMEQPDNGTKPTSKAADKSVRPTSAQLVGRCGQIFLQRDFEIHQLVPFGIAHAREVKIRAGQWHGNSRDIEEQESRL